MADSEEARAALAALAEGDGTSDRTSEGCRGSHEPRATATAGQRAGSTADRAVMAEVIELAIQNARGETIDEYRVQRIIQQVQDSIYEFPFRLPRELALVMRVGTITEGVCVTLDPEFDFIDTATGYLSEQGYREETIRRVATEVGSRVQEAGSAAIRVPSTFGCSMLRTCSGIEWASTGSMQPGWRTSAPMVASSWASS
mgnify:CR=1 FL=1